jgi:hypothetical protein
MKMFLKILALVVMCVLVAQADATLVAHWSCDQTGSTVDGTLPSVLEDSTGNYDGSFVYSSGAIEFISSGAGAEYGNAFSTNNLNNKVDIGYQSGLNFGTGDFTITGWFCRTNQARHGRIFQNGWFGEGGYHVTANKAGNLIFGVNGNGGDVDVRTDFSVVDSAWHWFAGVVKNQTLYLYFDGVLVDSGTAYEATTIASSLTTRTATIAKDMADDVDDIAIFDTALTATVDISGTLTGGELYDAWQNPIPEPATIMLLSIGAFGLVKRNKK